MKKNFTLVALTIATAMTLGACSSENKENDSNGNAEQEQNQLEQEITQDLQDGTPVEVDVEGASVTTEANGAQEVQTEVTLTPEQQQ